MICAKCQKEVPVGDTHCIRGEWLCENCYISVVQPSKPCDLKSFPAGPQPGSYSIKDREM